MHSRPDGGGSDRAVCAVCDRVAGSYTTLVVHDRMIIVAVALCPTCVTGLTACEGIDRLDTR